jgi:hypothetical protein
MAIKSYRISLASNKTPQQLRRFAVERLDDRNVATMCHHELEAGLSGALEPDPLSLNDKWKRMEESSLKSSDKHHRLHTKTSGKRVV